MTRGRISGHKSQNQFLVRLEVLRLASQLHITFRYVADDTRILRIAEFIYNNMCGDQQLEKTCRRY
jgi:hypothetical protein